MTTIQESVIDNMACEDGGLLHIPQQPRSSFLAKAGFLCGQARSVAQAIALIVWLNLVGATQAQETPHRSLSRIAAGTPVENSNAPHWNRIVLLAMPKLSSGDVDKIPASIRDSVSSFILTILATVEGSDDLATGETKYVLKELGVGYSTDVQGKLKVVTVADASSLGVSLGFISRQMLSENEKLLATANLIARTSTLAIFDTPTILYRDQSHKDFVTRHFVWIDSRSGRNAALVWLLERDEFGKLSVVNHEPPRWLPPGVKEVRDIHVDGKEFSLLGIPSKRAFALEDLPPGKPFPWSEEALALAAREGYDEESLRQLTDGLNQCLQALKPGENNSHAADKDAHQRQQR